MKMPHLFLLVDRLPSLTAREYALALDQRAAQQAAFANTPTREQAPSEKR